MPAKPTPAHDRIRILWLIKGLGPGGAERLLLESAQVVDRSRFDYRIAYLRPDKTHLVDAFTRAGISSVRLGASSPHRFGWLIHLRHLMRTADVVHAHSPVIAATARVVALSIPYRERPAVVTTEHNEWTSHRLPTRILNGLTAAVDSRHWAVSEQVRSTIWRAVRPRVTVLTHGIDLSGISHTGTDEQRLRSGMGVPDDAVLAITVANLRRTKDYPNLLRAARLAHDVEPRLHFAAVGQGPLENEIRALRDELGLDGTFRLLGYRTDVHALMAAANIFVLGSAHEGLPVAIMEALASGLPVVATAVGGVPEAITSGEQGVLVPPGDSPSLAEALITLARDELLRQRMSEAARARSTAYDIRTAVAVQEAAYADLARRARATGSGRTTP